MLPTNVLHHTRSITLGIPLESTQSTASQDHQVDFGSRSVVDNLVPHVSSSNHHFDGQLCVVRGEGVLKVAHYRSGRFGCLRMLALDAPISGACKGGYLLVDLVNEGGSVDGARCGIVVARLRRWLDYRNQGHLGHLGTRRRWRSAGGGAGNEIGKTPFEGVVRGKGLVDSNQDVHRWTERNFGIANYGLISATIGKMSFLVSGHATGQIAVNRGENLLEQDGYL